MHVSWMFGKEQTEVNELRIHGVYKHFKGNYYIVEDVAFDSETKEELISII